MREFTKKFSRLNQVGTDDEAVASISELFASLGEEVFVQRFFSFPSKDKRYFLVKFANAEDAIRVVNRYKLRSFGFNNVLLEFERKQNTTK